MGVPQHRPGSASTTPKAGSAANRSLFGGGAKEQAAAAAAARRLGVVGANGTGGGLEGEPSLLAGGEYVVSKAAQGVVTLMREALAEACQSGGLLGVWLGVGGLSDAPGGRWGLCVLAGCGRPEWLATVSTACRPHVCLAADAPAPGHTLAPAPPCACRQCRAGAGHVWCGGGRGCVAGGAAPCRRGRWRRGRAAAALSCSPAAQRPPPCISGEPWGCSVCLWVHVCGCDRARGSHAATATTGCMCRLVRAGGAGGSTG